jgi:hypothetical protein
MAISEVDVKRLWGKAAGRCSFPACNVDCLPFLDLDAPTVVGEMAHVIAQSSGGPRGGAAAGADAYANLILLCPTHHTLVDKAPDGKYTVEMLLEWKADHEQRVEALLRSPVFPNREQLDAFIRACLIENKACWATYGPESEAAKRNPNSSLGLFWPFRKLSLIVPNNRRIASAIKSNQPLFGADEYRTACLFIEHAEGFERNCTTPTEDVPRFPVAFGEIFDD